MEISSFPTIRYHNHIDHYRLQNRYSSYSYKTFAQISKRRRRIYQRVIPLTQEMMDSAASQSSTSISEKYLYNSIPLSRLVREEVQNGMKEFIRKEEIGDLIDTCLRENMIIVQDKDDKSLCEGALLTKEVNMALNMLRERDRNELVVDNLRILERRVTNIEDLLKCKIQGIPMKKHSEVGTQKIHTDVNNEDQMEVNNIHKQTNNLVETISVTQPEEMVLEEGQTKGNLTIYDEMYYKSREYVLNMLNYTKSLSTIKLNKKLHLNPYVKPIAMVLPEAQLKRKQRSIFIINNN